VGCKWLFNNKLIVDGSFQRHKTQLVAKGFNQTEGFDYTDLVVKHNTVGCKWLFKNKLIVDGSFQRHKTQLVAKGLIKLKALIIQI